MECKFEGTNLGNNLKQVHEGMVSLSDVNILGKTGTGKSYAMAKYFTEFIKKYGNDKDTKYDIVVLIKEEKPGTFLKRVVEFVGDINLDDYPSIKLTIKNAERMGKYGIDTGFIEKELYELSSKRGIATNSQDVHEVIFMDYLGREDLALLNKLKDYDKERGTGERVTYVYTSQLGREYIGESFKVVTKVNQDKKIEEYYKDRNVKQAIAVLKDKMYAYGIIGELDVKINTESEASNKLYVENGGIKIPKNLYHNIETLESPKGYEGDIELRGYSGSSIDLICVMYVKKLLKYLTTEKKDQVYVLDITNDDGRGFKGTYKHIYGREDYQLTVDYNRDVIYKEVTSDIQYKIDCIKGLGYKVIVYGDNGQLSNIAKQPDVYKVETVYTEDIENGYVGEITLK